MDKKQNRAQEWSSIQAVLGTPLSNLRVRPNRQSRPPHVDLSRIGQLLRPDVRQPPPKDIGDARKCLEEYLGQRAMRFKSASQFLADNGVQMDDTLESVKSVNRFFAESVFSNQEKTDMDPVWYGFIWDYALFLGEIAIKQANEFHEICWDVVDVGLTKFGQPFKPAIVLSKYPVEHFDMRPDRVMHQLGIRMLKANPRDLTAGGRFDHPYDFFSIFLEKSLSIAKIKDP